MSSRPFDTLCMIGAGTIGRQIALACAVHGYIIWQYDSSPEALQRAAARRAEEGAPFLQAAGIAPEEAEAALAHIRYTSDLAEAVRDTALVIEAVPEQLELKREVFARLDAICPPSTILATNSSSLRISLIEDVTQRPDRVLNIHYYAPIWQRPMVDLMRGTATSDETMEIGRRFVRSLGMLPLVVGAESTGFVFNRVWRAVKKECLRLVDQGVASPEDVDRAWMIFNGAPMGPFAFMDVVGLDVVRDIELVYYRESGDPSDYPPRVLTDKIERGELGIKTGKGFYPYPQPPFEQPGWLMREDEE